MRAGWTIGLGAAIAMLAGCSQARFENTAHPEYGAQQYDAARAACEKANTRLVTRNGYDVTVTPVIDQDAVAACLDGQGWRPAGR